MQDQPRPVRTAVRVLLIGLLVMLVPAGVLFAAGPSKPGITLQISPASQSIQQGKAAGYVVSVTSTGGFAGAVGLKVTGLPGGSSAVFSPASVTLSSGGTTTSAMNVSTTSSTPVGSYTLTVTGTSGKISGSVTAGLTVNYQISGSFSLSATPASVTIAPGATAAYSIVLSRNSFPGPVTLSILGGLPSGSVSTFSPNPVTGGSSTLQITTAASATAGNYTLYLVGSGLDAAGKTQYAYASAQLVLDTSLRQFTLSGNLSDPKLLAPGTSLPLDLQISNPNAKPLQLTNISVSIASVTRTADAISRSLPCAAADYTVTQYGGPYPFTVQSGNNSLSGLNIDPSSWPRIGMLDTPANQDGCKGATLQLTYSGSGQGN